MVGRKPNIRLMRLNDLRRRMNLPQVRAYESSLSEALAHNAETGAVPALSQLKVDDLRERVDMVLPFERNPLAADSFAAQFAGTDVNLVAYAAGRQAQLDVYRYRDVLFVSNSQIFTIWRDGVMDENSTGVFAALGRHRRWDPVTVPRAALCDDRYRPSNPCHFMVDRLPRVHFMTAHLGVAEADCVMVGATSDYARFALAKAAPAVRSLEPNTVYKFDELLVLSSSVRPKGHPFHYLRPEVVDAIVPKITGDLPAGRNSRRIYMSRVASDRRRLLNEDALIERLEGLGFESLEMSDFSPAEQLAAVRDAEVVVAPHGAAIANILGANPQSRLIELFNPQKGTAVYGALAGLVGARYTPLFGTPVADRNNKDAWTIDPEAVTDALENALP